LVLAQAIVGFGFHRFSEGALKAELFTWHKTIGPVILLLVLARLWYRLKNPPPPFPPELPGWERMSAVWNHRFFYTLLIAMPLVGLAAISGGAEEPTTTLAGGIPFPLIPGISKQTGDLLGEIHMVAAWLLVASILIHVAAALKHQFVDRWRGSARMPPFSSFGEPVAIGQGGESVRED
ncbi:MAG TPA: cytochrome b/b6 domain-containing protein, partial [Sphingomicrobium sp.]|nr:cytochrome b/b6 domain-containing protein [Sphingomicrobium sp.]